MLQTVLENIGKNLFNPLLLFFFTGFLIPLLKVEFEFPKALYQSLTIVLLLGIGWHGGEELSKLPFDSALIFIAAFMALGFVMNSLVGTFVYYWIRLFSNVKKIDAAAIAGHYGSTSAGTFVTALGFLNFLKVATAPYMPVLLAVMEIPGCIVALFLASRLRHFGLDSQGRMPGEPDYVPPSTVSSEEEIPAMDISLMPSDQGFNKRQKKRFIDGHLLHEVFLNPGTFLLFAGVIIGLLSGLQGVKVTEPVDHLFNFEFQPILCLFLMEMGTTACRRIKDLKAAGPGFVAFGIITPNLLAAVSLFVLYGFVKLTGMEIELGTYLLFMVLCASASYIAVPALQRMAIPEASPTLPLAAALGLTFTYNVTVGIPLYFELVKLVVGTS
ncbi:sodium-dependent bicarbonate transport family permease [bacterium]|nr:sodium-dependent bicarbonate transport family permease [bacterium]